MNLPLTETGPQGRTAVLAPVEEIIAEARAGRMFILVDDEDRENEGDLVIPARFAGAEVINFMARHARGLICLCLDRARVAQLQLAPMVDCNTSVHNTAFLQSIEAREGITTGISAFDRAETIRVASDPAFGPADIVTPGHVFPLQARDGGVLERAGHTEASVDICRLAGVGASAVICEIMRDDGTMARLPDLADFAARHGLKIGSIADLVAWRQRHDGAVREVSRRRVAPAQGGDWMLHLFSDAVTGARHLAMTTGEVADGGPVPVWMQGFDPQRDLLGLGEASGPDPVTQAISTLGAGGRGAVILLGLDGAEQVPAGTAAQIMAALGLSQPCAVATPVA